MRVHPTISSLMSLAALSSALMAAQTVRVDTSQVLNRFDPRTSLGSGVDRIPVGAIDHDFTPEALKRVFAAGWQPVTYRQNTDLVVEAWHWNPEGTWSEPGGTGYLRGRRLERIYSLLVLDLRCRIAGLRATTARATLATQRLTDGDENTYWKSNPYLASPLRARAMRCIRSG